MSLAVQEKRAFDSLVFEPPPIGTVLYLPGLPGSGSRTYDRSPYGNHGTIVGATWVRTPGGLWALNLDGTTGVVTFGIGGGLDFTEKFTVLIWREVTTSAAKRLFAKQKTDSYSSWDTYTYDGDFYFRILSTAPATYVTSSVAVTTGWHLLAGVYDKVNLIPYVDGVPGTPVAHTGDIIAGSAVELGRRKKDDNSYDAFLDGKAALGRIILTDLSAAQILDIRRQERHLIGVW